MRFALVLLLFASACAPVAGLGGPVGRAKPNRAILYPVGLNLLMSDGTLCAGHRPGNAKGWSGQLSGCPHPLSYQVSGSDPTIPRLELHRGEAGQGAAVSVDGVSFSAP
jgi:hypothetical protein